MPKAGDYLYYQSRRHSEIIYGPWWDENDYLFLAAFMAQKMNDDAFGDGAYVFHSGSAHYLLLKDDNLSRQILGKTDANSDWQLPSDIDVVVSDRIFESWRQWCVAGKRQHMIYEDKTEFVPGCDGRFRGIKFDWHINGRIWPIDIWNGYKQKFGAGGLVDLSRLDAKGLEYPLIEAMNPEGRFVSARAKVLTPRANYLWANVVLRHYQSLGEEAAYQKHSQSQLQRYAFLS